MPRHHFLSYSTVEAQEIVYRLHDSLEAQEGSIQIWLDKRDLKPGIDWDIQIRDAIRDCETLLFVMTPDSVADTSVCRDEWTLALKYKKPVIPLLLTAQAEAPFRLQNRQYIDFTLDFGSALDMLRQHLIWMASFEGQLQAMQDRLKDAERDLRRAATDTERSRIQAEIEQLSSDIEARQEIIDDPKDAEKRAKARIQLGIAKERVHETSPEKPSRAKFINSPPSVVPSYFQDRHVETQLIGEFLKDDTVRVITIIGRGGIGKTALVCRLLQALEAGHLPDNGEPLEVDGIVYLSERGSRRATPSNLFNDLTKLLPDDAALELTNLFQASQIDIKTKIQALLDWFTDQRVVVLLDNFEDCLDPDTRNLVDPEFEEVLRTLLVLPHHSIKVIITSRFAPYKLTLEQPHLQRRVDLDEGLPSPYAENILREMDADGMMGLRDAPPSTLDVVRQLTRGYPRALEALYAILAADRDTTLEELVENTKSLLPDNVVEALIGEAFNRLEPLAQTVMQALAIYNRPVTAVAVNFLVQPYVGGIDTTSILVRLVNMQFVRKEGEQYYLHPVDRTYALACIPRADELSREKSAEPEFEQHQLFSRAADFFAQLRKPSREWRTIDDLEPQIAEFVLRCEAEEYSAAFKILSAIDSDYLYRWGHNREMARMHLRLKDKLDDPVEHRVNVGTLGHAYTELDQLEDAIDCYEEALALAKDQNKPRAQAVWMHSLGSRYMQLGRYPEAIESFESALSLSRRFRDRTVKAALLAKLGLCHASLGDTLAAIDYQTQAFKISRRAKDKSGQAGILANLGSCNARLGKAEQALENFQRALTLEEEIDNRPNQVEIHYRRGLVLLEQGKTLDVVSLCQQALEFADTIDAQKIHRRIRHLLALAHLVAGDPKSAQQALGKSASSNNNLTAIIALRNEEQQVAQQAFSETLAKADELLAYTDQNFEAWDNKGLGLCGLALCGLTHHIPEAIEAFNKARQINHDLGTIHSVRLYFDALTVVDLEGLLTEAQRAMLGELV